MLQFLSQRTDYRAMGGRNHICANFQALPSACRQSARDSNVCAIPCGSPPIVVCLRPPFWAWAARAGRRSLLGPVELVVAGSGVGVARNFSADGAGITIQQPSDSGPLVLAQIAIVDEFGLVHGGTIPVHAGFPVTAGGARPAVPPCLVGVLRDTDRVWAVQVKFRPSTSRSLTYSARLASHISFRDVYSTPLNTQRCSCRPSSWWHFLLT